MKKVIVPLLISSLLIVNCFIWTAIYIELTENKLSSNVTQETEKNSDSVKELTSTGLENINTVRDEFNSKSNNVEVDEEIIELIKKMEKIKFENRYEPTQSNANLSNPKLEIKSIKATETKKNNTVKNKQDNSSLDKNKSNSNNNDLKINEVIDNSEKDSIANTDKVDSLNNKNNGVMNTDPLQVTDLSVNDSKFEIQSINVDSNNSMIIGEIEVLP